MGVPHILMIPFPAAQGHAIPMLEFARILAKQGLKITLVNTTRTHHFVAGALADKGMLEEKIKLVSILDDSPGDTTVTLEVMREIIEKLVDGEPEGEKISCIIGDQNLGWAMEIGKKMGIKRAAFLPSAAAVLVMGSTIPRLIDEGVIFDFSNNFDKMV